MHTMAFIVPLLLSIATITAPAPHPEAQQSCLRIVEVYASPGDGGYPQFVDLFNFCDTPVDLSLVELRWTDDVGAYTNATPLKGVMSPGTCVTVGDHPGFGLPYGFEPAMSSVIADDLAAGVGIFRDGKMESAIDALVYGGDNELGIAGTKGVVAATGAATIPQLGYGFTRWGDTWFATLPNPCGGGVD